MEADKVISEASPDVPQDPKNLNELFKLVYYNGALLPKKTVFENMFNLDNLKVHCTDPGSNFELVMKYTGKEKEFTLSHFLVRGGGFGCTAPLKDGLLWVRDEQPSQGFFDPFKDFTEEKFRSYEKKNNDSDPILFFSTDIKTLQFQCELPTWATGKYICILWIRKHEVSGGNNIDIDWMALVGYEGEKKQKTKKSSHEFLNHHVPHSLEMGVPDNTFPVVDGKPLRSLKGHAGDVEAAIISEERLFVASGAFVRAWSLNTNKLLYSMKIGSVVYTMSIHKDEIYCSTHDDYIRVLSCETGEVKRMFGGLPRVFKMEVADGKIYCGNKNGEIMIVNAETGAIVKNLDYNNKTRIYSFLMHNHKIYSSSNEGTAGVWDEKEQKFLGFLPGHHSRVITNIVAFKNKLFCASIDGHITVTDIETRKLVQNFTLDKALGLKKLIVTDDKFFINTWTLEAPFNTKNKVLVFRRETLECIQEWSDTVDISEIQYHNNKLYCVSHNNITAWDCNAGISTRIFSPVDDTPNCLTVLDNQILVGGNDRLIRIYNRESGECTRILRGHEAAVTCVEILDQNIYSGSADKTIRIWDRKTGNCLEIWEAHGDAITEIEIRNDVMYTCSLDHTVKIWQKTGEGLGVQTPIKVLPHNSGVKCMLVTNKHIISGTEDDVVNIWDKEKLDVPLKLEKVHKPFKCDYYDDDGISCLLLFGGMLISSGMDGAVVVYDPKDNFKVVQTCTEHFSSIYAMKAGGEYLFTASNDETVTVWSMVDKKLKKVSKLRGHIHKITCLGVGDDGKVYTGSRDFTIREWNLPIIMGPHTVISNYSLEWIEKAIKEKKDKSFWEPIFLLICAFGQTYAATKIMEAFGLKLTTLIARNSGLFEAVKNRQWSFLAELSKKFENKKEHFGVSRKNLKLIHYLQERSRQDDTEFFSSLLASPIIFPRVEVIAYSFLPPKQATNLDLLRFWMKQTPNVNAVDVFNQTLLHYAIHFGCVEATKILVDDAKLKANIADVNGQTPMHHVFSKFFDPLDGRRGIRTVFELQIDRLECANYLLANGYESSKVNMLAKDMNGVTPYELLMRLYQHSKKILRSPYLLTDIELPVVQSNFEYRIVQNKLSRESGFFKEFDDDEPFVNIKEAGVRPKTKRETEQDLEKFKKICEILDLSHDNNDEVRNYRDGFASITFFKRAIPYGLWLTLLLIVAMLHKFPSGLGYQYTQSITSTFLKSGTPAFESIESPFEYWQWFRGPFIDGLNELETHPSGISQNNSGVLLNGHRIIGAIQIRQLRVKQDCKIPSQFGDTIQNCQPVQFINDKDPYGPNLNYTYSDDQGEVYWSFLEGYYPKGGFVQNIDPFNKVGIIQLGNELESGKWIDEQTRIIFVTFTIYNSNLNLFASVKLILEFPASGNLYAYSDVYTFKSLRYNDHQAYVVLAFEIIVVIFFLLEFPIQEVIEMINKRSSYLLDGWNYFEWLIISLFATVVGIRIATDNAAVGLDLNASNTTYINFQVLGLLSNYSDNITSLLILLCCLRGLKFLRIPPRVGPTAMSILDTLKNQSFIVFISIFFFVLLSFAFMLHISFGKYIFEVRDVPHAMVSVFPYLLNGLDYNSLEDSNRIGGVIFFLLFVLICTIVLLNMLIAVLSEVYINLQKQNIESWEQEINRLIIKSILTNGRISALDFVVFYSKKLFRCMYKRSKRVDLEKLKLGDGATTKLSSDEIALEIVNEKEVDNKADDSESVDTIGTKELLVEETLKKYSNDQLRNLQLKYRIQRSQQENIQTLHDIKSKQTELAETLARTNLRVHDDVSEMREELKQVTFKLNNDIQSLRSDLKVLIELMKSKQ